MTDEVAGSKGAVYDPQPSRKLPTRRMAQSKSQIDRLGERLKRGSPTDQDLRDIDTFRLSFAAAYEEIVRIIESIGEAPSGRPAKSTAAIVEKLRRESIRLSQMQDIAGCRIVVETPGRQRALVRGLQAEFPGAAVIDRLATPSHGYRAIHLVVIRRDVPVEIQVRTQLQHAWAQHSERAADVHDPAIKYGGGSPKLKSLLDRASSAIAEFENLVGPFDAAAEEAERLLDRAKALHAELERVRQASDAAGAARVQVALDDFDLRFLEASSARDHASKNVFRAGGTMLAAMSDLVEALQERNPDSQ